MPLPTLLPLAAVLLSAASSFEPAQVDARGERTSTLSVATPGLWHVEASSPTRTTCTLVDALRGPSNTGCSFDVMLDARPTLLRLGSPARGKGKVKLSATPYEPIEATPAPIARGERLTRVLPTGRAATFSFDLSATRQVLFELAGRTLGAAAVWRDGRWLEPSELVLQTKTPAVGKPVGVGQLSAQLEPGHYVLALYGTADRSWVSPPGDDTVEVTFGFQPGADGDGPLETRVEGVETVTLSPRGLATLAVGTKEPRVAAIHWLGGGNGGVQVVTHAQSPNLGTLPNPRQLGRVDDVPGQRMLATQLDGAVEGLVLTGPANATVEVAWGPRSRFGAPGQTVAIPRPVPSGPTRIAVVDIGADPDAAPLSCTVEMQQLDNRGTAVGSPIALAWDWPKVGADRPMRQRFNYDGSSELVAFEWEGAGREMKLALRGSRKSRCELFRDDNGSRSRVAGSETEGCRLTVTLTAGRYLLRTWGGEPGIEELWVVPDLSQQGPYSPAHPTCAMEAPLEPNPNTAFRVVASRVGRIAGRGLELTSLNVGLKRALALDLQPGVAVPLPLAPNMAWLVRSTSPVAIENGPGGLKPLTVEARGEFTTPAAIAGLTLRAEKAAHVVLVPRPRSPWKATPEVVPPLQTALALTAGKPTYADYERGQYRTFTFTVPANGVWSLETTGLLETGCALRTETQTNLPVAQQAGRGRNCRIAGWLPAGVYRATVTARGQSTGRAGVVVAALPLRTGPRLVDGKDAYVTAAADEAFIQRFDARRGTWRLQVDSASELGGCRLEDPKGWPLLALPHGCSLEFRPPAGGDGHALIQLPASVEGSRRIAVTRNRVTKALAGGKANAVELQRPYVVKQGKGEDRFTFDLRAEADLFVELGGGMQGRIERLDEKGVGTAVEVIAPQSGGRSAAAPSESEESEGEESPGIEASDEPVEEGEGEGPGEEPVERPRPMVRVAFPEPVVPPLPMGQKVHLPAGRYALVARHAESDVGHTYTLALRTPGLVPGTTTTVPAPARLELVVPAGGTVRLTGSGPTDTRWRIYDLAGRLVLESSRRGSDWNPAFAEALPAGRYRLDAELESGSPGPTTLRYDLLEAQPAEGNKVKLGGRSVRFAMPPLPDAFAEDVVVRSKAPLSCALVDGRGSRLATQSSTSTCGWLVTPQAGLSVEVWSLEEGAEVELSRAPRRLADGDSSISPGTVVRRVIEPMGRFTTAPGVLCLREGSHGAFQPCGRSVSLSAGPWLFGLVGAANTAPLPLTLEVIGGEAFDEALLAPGEAWFARTADTNGPVLTGLLPKDGVTRVPGCVAEAGLSRWSDLGCFTATDGRSRLVTVRDPAGGRFAVTSRGATKAVRLPFDQPGDREVAWEEAGLRVELPRRPWRASLVLPARVAAIAVDVQGTPVGLCAPASRDQGCSLSGESGSLVLLGPAGRSWLRVDGAARASPAIPLGGLREWLPRTPGIVTLEVASASAERRLSIEGADGCRLQRDDGFTSDRCDDLLPAGLGVRVLVEEGRRGIRAALSPLDSSELRAGNLPAVASGPLAAREATPLEGAVVAREVVLTEPSLLTLTADSGVCVLGKGKAALVTGTGEGCVLHRWLPPGTHRFSVRRFAEVPLTGAVTWSAEPVADGVEGLGAERRVGPGRAVAYRFSIDASRKVGLGVRGAAGLGCELLDVSGARVGEGCLQFPVLTPGSYAWVVSVPGDEPAAAFQPVLLGLVPPPDSVPDDYLQELQQRAGESR